MTQNEYENVFVNSERWFDIKPLKNEIWCVIKDNSNYEISNYGRVKSKYFHNGNTFVKREKILKNLSNLQGYLYVSLYTKGKKKNYRINRLVAIEFIPNKNNCLEVNHKDEIITNNRIDNLEWCDRIYNNNYGTRNKKISQNKSRPILQFDRNGNFIKKWNSAKKASEVLKISRTSIVNCLSKRTTFACGYIWRYEV